MCRLFRLSDAQWAKLRPLLPSETKTGGRDAKPHRPMVEAMIWILRTGAPWRDLPPEYGPWKSVYTRFSRWSREGVYGRLLEALARERDGEGYLLDATIVRAHQDAAGAKGGLRNRSGARAEAPRPRSTRSSTPSEILSVSRFRRVKPTRCSSLTTCSAT